MPDVNVLLYAHRVHERAHQLYKKWWADVVNGPQPFALSTLVAVGFVRIVTNAQVFRAPTELSIALATIDQIVAHPRCRLLGPESNHWQRVSDLCRKTNATGKLVADAQHAAVAIANGCTWVSRDADFAVFAPHGLSWKHLAL